MRPESRPAVVRRLVTRALRYELGMWWSLYRWIFRRRASEFTGARTFGYAGPITPIFGAFIGLSAVEIPILHLLLPWETVRLIALALGLYGLFWMIGLLASIRVNPHTLDADGLTVRYGPTIAFTIAWTDIAAITVNDRTREKSRSVQLDRTDDGVILNLVILSGTGIDVTLTRPVLVDVAALKGEPVTAVRLSADDPRALVTAAREHLAAATATDTR